MMGIAEVNKLNTVKSKNMSSLVLELWNETKSPYYKGNDLQHKEQYFEIERNEDGN